MLHGGHFAPDSAAPLYVQLQVATKNVYVFRKGRSDGTIKQKELVRHPPAPTLRPLQPSIIADTTLYSFKSL
jgi:hypothetical protein